MRNQFSYKARRQNSVQHASMTFSELIEGAFGAETKARVESVFKKLHLPLPRDEFVKGAEGALVFINPYAVVIRVEGKNFSKGERIEDKEKILRPLASIDAGEALVQIYPGCLLNADPNDAQKLDEELRAEGVKFSDKGFDDGVRQVGFLPALSISGMKNFPEHMRMAAMKRYVRLIDIGAAVRLPDRAVRQLTNGVRGLAGRLKKPESMQDKLYGVLRRAFDKAWPQGRPEPYECELEVFWCRCAELANKGRLVPGWLEYRGDEQKALSVGHAAISYEKLFTGKYLRLSRKCGCGMQPRMFT